MKVTIGKKYSICGDTTHHGLKYGQEVEVLTASLVNQLTHVKYLDERNQYSLADVRFADIEELEVEESPSKPAHYDTGIDAIAFMRANCPPEQVEGFLRGNALKYLQRYDKKNGVQDLKKARHYIEMLIEEVEGR